MSRKILICPTCDTPRTYLPRHKQYRCQPCDSAKAAARWARIKDTHTGRIGQSWYRAKHLGVPSQEVPALIAAILETQSHQCAICRTPITDRADLDHDHATGTSRGLLCQRCNTAIHILDDPAWLEGALTYLDTWRTAAPVLPATGARS